VHARTTHNTNKNHNGGRMKKLCTAALVIFLTGSSTLATQADKQQKQSTAATATSSASANTQTQASAGSRAVTLDSGSQIDAEITSALDLKKAKPGDSFKMKTTKPVKHQGKEIISKGSTITGHVQQATTADKTTQATLVFDQLNDSKTHVTSSLSAVVTAIAKPVSASAMTQDDTMSNVSGGGGRTQQSSSQSGGLLGGVTQTVGGVTQTAGGVVGQAGSTVSSTTNTTLGSATGVTGGVGGAVGGLTGGTIQIVNDTTASAASGSTLTMATRNAKLESGIQFMLQTTSALTLTKVPKQK
jgi:hypothetical protein